jgi:hypothetical protein
MWLDASLRKEWTTVQQPGGQPLTPWSGYAPVADQQFQAPQAYPQPPQYLTGQQAVPAQQVPMYPQPQTGAAPVPGVAYPSQVGGGGPQGAQPQSPQQAMARQLMGVARGLEQIIPGYQLLVSVFQDALVSPRAHGLAGVQPLLEQLKEAIYHHFVTLGAVRRFLMGEVTPDILASLATGVNYLNAIHSRTKPLFEQVLASASPELRAPLGNLAQTLTAAEGLLIQTTQAVRTLVGPQIWDACKDRAAGVATVE